MYRAHASRVRCGVPSGVGLCVCVFVVHVCLSACPSLRPCPFGQRFWSSPVHVAHAFLRTGALRPGAGHTYCRYRSRSVAPHKSTPGGNPPLDSGQSRLAHASVGSAVPLHSPPPPLSPLCPCRSRAHLPVAREADIRPLRLAHPVCVVPRLCADCSGFAWRTPLPDPILFARSRTGWHCAVKSDGAHQDGLPTPCSSSGRALTSQRRACDNIPAPQRVTATAIRRRPRDAVAVAGSSSSTRSGCARAHVVARRRCRRRAAHFRCRCNRSKLPRPGPRPLQPRLPRLRMPPRWPPGTPSRSLAPLRGAVVRESVSFLAPSGRGRSRLPNASTSYSTTKMSAATKPRASSWTKVRRTSHTARRRSEQKPYIADTRLVLFSLLITHVRCAVRVPSLS
jgi:hypothetical protein